MDVTRDGRSWRIGTAVDAREDSTDRPVEVEQDRGGL
jgi:hypothetical protein